MRFEYAEVSYVAAVQDAVERRVMLLLAGLDRNVERSLRASDLNLQVRCDNDGAVEMLITPATDIIVKSCVLSLRHEFAENETVLLNGYQSWTDTHVLSLDRKIAGLNNVPNAMVQRFALDGSGDYRFVDYRDEPGCFHGYTYAMFAHVDDDGRHQVLVASLDESRGFTEIRMDSKRSLVQLRPECPQVTLPANEQRSLCRVVLLAGDEECMPADEPGRTLEDALYDRWFVLVGIRAREVRPLVGYTSWYRHYGDISQEKLESDLAGAQEALAMVRDLDVVPLFQIDDGYCKVGDWLEVNGDRFPDGLAPLAARIREAGFLPGLWIAPFVCERDSRLFKEHPDWLLRADDGTLCQTGPHWSGGYALDITNQEVRAYVSQVVSTMVREWGFGLLKLDFLYGACMVEHAGLNRGELMAEGARLLREAAGDECLLLGCGVPLGSVFGVFDYCRIGCDVGLNWDGDFVWRRLQRERVSTKNSMLNTVARAPLDGRAFACDPDVFFLRDDVHFTKSQRELLLGTDACYASMLLTSDDMGLWDDEQRAWFRAAVEVLAERKKR